MLVGRDEERVEQLLAEPVMAKRPEGATVVQAPVGLVSEDENIQFADGGDNGALLQLPFPADTSLEALGRDYADTVEAEDRQANRC